MKILWHCRGCNAIGEANLEFNAILDIWHKYNEQPKNNITVLDTVMNSIEHECNKKDIGIRST